MITRKYGLPYRGSKSCCADKILDMLPPATHFYDLFCGGCAMSQAAAKRYEVVHANDINASPILVFNRAVRGRYANECRWIDREEWKSLNSDPFIELCWSFDGIGKYYRYSKSTELFKQGMHEALYYDDWRILANLGIRYADIGNMLSERRKRLYRALQSQNGRVVSCTSPRLETAEYLEAVNGLTGVDISNIIFTQGSFENVMIEPDSVVFCDIPYRYSADYGNVAFDYSRFYSWCMKQDNVYITEFEMPAGFVEIGEVHQLRPAKGNWPAQKERLYTTLKKIKNHQNN